MCNVISMPGRILKEKKCLVLQTAIISGPGLWTARTNSDVLVVLGEHFEDLR